MVDLHIHTLASDGALTPAEVVRYAHQKQLTGIAITDHDTTAGNAEGLAEGARLGLPVIPGVEISTEWQGTTFHLLGYGLTRSTAETERSFAFLLESRAQRNPRMVQKLRDLGMDVTMEDVLRESNGSVMGRPHIARALVRLGHVRSNHEAFDRFLRRGGAAYVDKQRLNPADAFALIRACGGVPVLAHPGLLEQENPSPLGPLVEHLLELGLEGIEAYYTRHTQEQVGRYTSLARRHGLLITGGSDFHRSDEGGPELGTGYGSLRVPDDCHRALIERLGLG